MGLWCRCVDCSTDFIDNYGEFTENGYLVCPACHSKNILTGSNEIPDFKDPIEI